MTKVDEMKLGVLAYWRYSRQHIMGAIECSSSDVLTITKSLMITETEVKVSIGDMRREVKTKFCKHSRMMAFGEQHRLLMPSANYFYFAVPEELKEKALNVCQERYPYAGLLIYKNGVGDFYSPSLIVSVVKTAKRFKRPKPGMEEILRIGYAASNTAIRYGNKLKELNASGKG